MCFRPQHPFQRRESFGNLVVAHGHTDGADAQVQPRRARTDADGVLRAGQRAEGLLEFPDAPAHAQDGGVDYFLHSAAFGVCDVGGGHRDFHFSYSSLENSYADSSTCHSSSETSAEAIRFRQKLFTLTADKFKYSHQPLGNWRQAPLN